MNGMAQLLQLRRKGYKPACACIYDDSSVLFTSAAKEWPACPNKHAGNQLFARIQLDEADQPEQIDFRPLTGLEVYLLGFRGDDRTTRIFNAVKRVNPALLAAGLSGALMIFKKETGDEFHSYA